LTETASKWFADSLVLGLDVYRKRGTEGLPLERVYRQLFDPKLYLRAYGKIYRNDGAMTEGSTEETVDGMSLKRINATIDLLKHEQYRWTPVRREYIAKTNGSGKKRPLGLPTWSDKLLQEVLRMLFEAYHEPRFSDRSHGFRPGRSCHSALNEIRKTWRGTIWFIEGDIKGAYDNMDHQVMLEILQRHIHDGRMIGLIDGLLKAGYLENWRSYDTLTGVPQGGIISPLLFNIYMTELDKFVEDTLIPAYTKGDRRKENPEYTSITTKIAAAKRRGDSDESHRLRAERRKLLSKMPCDPDYRRLRYIRYADDFLLGFVGPKKEAEEIRRKLGEFLMDKLKLTLSPEKTLITHARDEKARFLGYEIMVSREGSLLNRGNRTTNGSIALLMPRKVICKYRDSYSRKGKIRHRAEILNDSAYSIIQRYQGVMCGLYNFYCMAVNVSRRMSRIKWILETSLTRTLASKYKCKVSEVYARHQVVIEERKMLQVRIERPDREPLIATFGGFPFERKPDGMGVVDFSRQAAWNKPAGQRSEVVQRLLFGVCELCGVKNAPLEAHHIRKLADINRPGRRPKAEWEKIMIARRRKQLMVCERCHDDIHAGRHDGPKL
jgi:group II intron reverse transcriptase/maturase